MALRAAASSVSGGDAVAHAARHKNAAGQGFTRGEAGTFRSCGERFTPCLPADAAGSAICSARGVKWISAAVVLAFGALILLPATALQVPTALHVGDQELTAASCATRDTLWVHHYIAALYIPPRQSPIDALQDPQQAKALQVQILSKTFLPKDMPKRWRQTLEKELDGDSFSSIRSAWRELRVGDRVTIAYAPGPGLTLQLNDQVVARSPRHAVVEALLETWADDEPVPQRLHRTVAKHPCRLS